MYVSLSVCVYMYIYIESIAGVGSERLQRPMRRETRYLSHV